MPTVNIGSDHRLVMSNIKLRQTPEGNLHQRLDDSPPTQRKQQDEHQERSSTGRYHIAQAVYGSTRKHIPTTDLGNMKIDDKYLSHLRFANDILICANTQHELQQMLQDLSDEIENQGLKMNKSKQR